MHVKKTISVWAIIALSFAQLAIAQHNAVHLDHGFHGIEIDKHAGADHGHNDENMPLSHECPECLLVKSLQTAFYAGQVISVDLTHEKALVVTIEAPFVSHIITASYNPRAPPFFLI